MHPCDGDGVEVKSTKIGNMRVHKPGLELKSDVLRLDQTPCEEVHHGVDWAKGIEQ